MTGCGRKERLHASAVGIDDRAVLLTGAGGGGKSSSALHCLCDGMQFAGDDYVVAQLQPEPRVFPIYSSAKVNHDNRENFPQLAELIVHEGGGQEKTIFQLYPTRQQQVKSEHWMHSFQNISKTIKKPY